MWYKWVNRTDGFYAYWGDEYQVKEHTVIAVYKRYSHPKTLRFILNKVIMQVYLVMTISVGE